MLRLLAALSATTLLAGCFEPVGPYTAHDAAVGRDAAADAGSENDADAAEPPGPDAGSDPADAGPTLLPCEAWTCGDAGACSRHVRPAGEVCRSGVGSCVEQEICDGVGGDCPAERSKPKATYCGNNSWCDGTSTVCPPGTPDWETEPGSHFYWTRPHPMGEDLYGLWTGASDDVWAVGAHGMALHWDGKAWSRVLTGTAARLHDVWGFSTNDVWAVGSGNTVLHWDGTAWAPVLTNLEDTHQYLGIWGASPQDLWAVGFDWANPGPEKWFTPGQFPPVIAHWDGTGWSEVAAPAYPGFRSVFGLSADEIWAVALNVIRWDGHAWSQMAGAGGGADLWGMSTDMLWSVSGNVGISSWNGSSWQKALETKSSCGTIWGSGPDDIWAAGGDSSRAGVPGSAVAHWDGDRWVEYPLPGMELRRIRGTSPNDIWAVGSSGTLFHWNGTSWASATEAAPELGVADVWGDSGDTWAVGTERRVDAAFGVTMSGLVVGNSGDGWRRQDAGPSEVLSALWGVGAQDLWAAGDQRAFHWDGSTWTGFDVGADHDSIHDLWGNGSDDLWAVGVKWSTTPQGNVGSPKAWHWNGSAWSEASVAAPVGSTLDGIWGTAPDDLWVIGNGSWPHEAFILHFDGTTWTQVTSVPGILHRVFGSGPDDVWTVGEDGDLTLPDALLLHWDGSAWTEVPVRPEWPLLAVWAGSSSDAWASGSLYWSSWPPPGSAELLRWDGTTWTSVPYGSDVGIYAIWGRSVDDVWFGGVGGAILQYRP
ncbi:MAG TPA: hypothetical protein VGK67_12885 [Myxococcales bacterium]